MQTKTALECKQLSKDIVNYDPNDWRERAGQLCDAGIEAKFVQNPSLLRLLVCTGDKTLVECSYDRLWANGLPLHNSESLDESEWVGENLLGNILMRIRMTHHGILGDNIR